MDTVETQDGDAVRHRPLVGFLGPQASYSHQASLQAFPQDEWDLTPLVTIPDIFTAVQAGHVTYGVVPFENSTNGSVLFTLDCFADRHGATPDTIVCGEIYLDVHHFLVGQFPPSPPPHPHPQLLPHFPSTASGAADDPGSGTCTPTASDPHPPKPRSKPRCSLAHVQRLYSHPQAWGQCSTFLQTYLKGVEAVDVSSTSRAAELVAQDETGTSAAVSSEIAARLHGIDVLAASIEDREDNTTRFFVIRRQTGAPGEGGDGPGRDWGEEQEPLPSRFLFGSPNKPTPAQGQAAEGDSSSSSSSGDSQKAKSMVSFVVPHEAPGALADVLSCFRSYGLNLTSINSRPSLTKPFQYVFFVEFEGHRERDPDGRVRGALEGVGKVAETWRWLGSWIDQRN